MAVPDFQSFMLPTLRVLSDGRERHRAEVIEAVALALGLTEEDRQEMLPSGRKSRSEDRTSWALIYLKSASLLENPSRGRYRISVRGMEVLGTGVKRIDTAYLMQFPKFAEFYGKKTDDGKPVGVIPIIPTATPEEELERTYQDWRRGIARELLEQVKVCSPRFFEQLVIDLLLAMGYGGSRRDAAQAVGRSGDDGVDGIVKEDRLGLDVLYVQAKRWDSTVGRPVVQAFVGSLEGKHARKGILITTSKFSQDAVHYVDVITSRVSLIDGEELAELMLDHGIGVTDVASYTVKRIDSDYFEAAVSG